jgi:uncharacterized protein
MSDARIEHRPWYREPMVWLVWGLPAAVVVASFLTLSIAIRSSGSVDAVRDPVQRVGKAQTFDLAPDRAAARLGLAAELRLAADTEAVELHATGGVMETERLSLVLTHPSESREDLSLELVRVEPERFVGRLAVPRDHAWNLHLAPIGEPWRLQGRLERGALSAELTPAVDGG